MPSVGEWREAGGTHSLENGITTFKGSPDAAAHEIVSHQLPTIDLHHGAHSHSPPWSVLEVYGAPPTTGLRTVLSEYGLTEVRATAHGFVATAPSVNGRLTRRSAHAKSGAGRGG